MIGNLNPTAALQLQSEIRFNTNYAHRLPQTLLKIYPSKIEIEINNIPTRITSAYCPKASPYFSNDIQLLTSLNTQYMIFGDFNAKHTSWNCRCNNSTGNLLFSSQQNNDFMIYHTDSHTHYPHSGQTPSTIDLLLSNVSFTFDLSTYHDQIHSDHAPIICNTGFVQRKVRKIFDYSRGDWNKYRRAVEIGLNSFTAFESPPEIDNAIDNFTKLIITAKANSVPLKSNSARSTISTHTKRIIQYKNALRRRWQRLEPGSEKQRAKRDLNEIKKYISQTVAAEYNGFMTNQLRHIKKGAKKLWQLSKSARGKNVCHTDKIKIYGLNTVDDNDKANCLAKIFEKSHTITSSFTHENDTNVSNTINAFNNFSHLRCQSPRIDRNEIYNIIKSFRPFKSPGPDTIQNILLKKLPPAAIDWITVLINKCVEKCHWPSSLNRQK